VKNILLLRPLLLAAICSFAITGCTACKNAMKPTAPPREAFFTKITFSGLNGWHAEDHLAALDSFTQSCSAILPRKTLSPLTSLGGGIDRWKQVCNAARYVHKSNEAARHFFETGFDVYKVSDSTGGALGKMTGYYEIELRGSLKYSKLYKYPVYSAPQNLSRLKGTHIVSRSAIRRGSLKGRQLEIVWVEDEARLFFMHIQGSGKIRLPNGDVIKLSYSDQNGFPYTSIWPYFKEYGATNVYSALDEMNWIRQHPKAGENIMEKNQSYVFFKKRVGRPIGAEGVSLTPERSIAIDSRIYPYGMPIWIETTLPHIKGSHHFRRLCIAQDTGGAIKGAIRADIFFGHGKVAEEYAAHMNTKGSFSVLVPKGMPMQTHYVTTQPLK